ncbi:calcium-activated chloride channel regulator 1-like [Glandiceps talaboti]
MALTVFQHYCLLFLMVATPRYSHGTQPTVEVSLNNNGYEGIVIAIHRDVPDEPALLDEIKNVFTAASATLYKATKKRAYFRNITILVPSSWSNDSNYDVASFELFETANIILDEPHPKYGDVPHVQQINKCGQPGTRMHLTRNFFFGDDIPATQGPRDKVIVHEWGHLRWGLFDEYVLDEGKKHFYRDGPSIIPVTCVKGISGKVKPEGDCKKWLDLNLLPPPECTYVPDSEQDAPIQASFMYAQWIDSVDGFCHGDPTDPNGFHARKAPNRQNDRCSGLSSWEVMKDRPDFKDDVNPPVNINDTAPTFKIVQTVGVRRVVLVLDISGSMSGDPIRRLHQSATHFIDNVIDDGSTVGIVEFDDVASVLAGMTVINNDQDRDNLASKVPSTTGGATSIGAGLASALQLLQNSSLPTKGSSFLLITDGQENTWPYIADVTDEVHEAGVRVDSIAYTQNAADELRHLSEGSGGKYYYTPTDDDITSLLDSLAATITSRPIDNYEAIPIVLESNAVTLSNANYTNIIYVDSDVGKNTVFTFLFSSTTVAVFLISPSGERIDSTYPGYDVNTAIKRVKIKINGIAEAGEWTYVVNGSVGSAQTVNVVLESRMKDPDDKPILVKAYLGASAVNYKEDPTMTILADVKKGYLTVLNADVIATVDGPAIPVKVKLLDNGAGADLEKDDGVYSAFFLDYSSCHGTCKYGVKIKVKNADGKAEIVKYDNSGYSPALTLNPENTARLNVTKVSADPFSRVLSAGAFDVEGGPDSSSPEDVFPPARIQDLEVEETFYENGTVVLAWTAVGDDFDRGTAQEYDLRMSGDVDELYDDLDNATKLTNEDLVSGNLSSPQISGSRERVTLIVNNTGGNYTYAFSLRALDKADNQGDPSNVVFTSVVYIPPSLLNPGTTTQPPEVISESGTSGLAVVIVVSGGGLAIYIAIVALVAVGVAKRQAKNAKKMKTKKKYIDTFLNSETMKLPRVSYRNIYLPEPQGPSTMEGQTNLVGYGDSESSKFTSTDSLDYEDIPESIEAPYHATPPTVPQGGLHSQTSLAYTTPPIDYQDHHLLPQRVQSAFYENTTIDVDACFNTARRGGGDGYF